MKLNARDLRTGNILKGKPISIPKLGIHGNGISIINAHGIDYIEQGLMPDDNYEPIPITTRTMAACGFKLNAETGSVGYIIWEHGEFDIYLYQSVGALDGVDIPYPVSGHKQPDGYNPIAYVHMLQNYFHGVTGGFELTIDTSKLI